MRFRVLLFLAVLLCGCSQARTAAAPTSPSIPTAQTSPSPSSYTPDPLLVSNLKAHVLMLATTIGQRNTATPEGYEKAAQYLQSSLTKLGYKVQRQTYQADGHPSSNLWTQRDGTGDEILVIGAHYDSLLSGTPGADDNASGCAALLELARLLKKSKKGPSVRFVLFANEEPPYFKTDTMGSLVYAKACQKADEKFIGMISLESIGFFSDEAGSQHFPTGLSGYPETGNYAVLISDLSSKAFLERCLAGFKAAETISAEGLAAPEFIEGITWSDHWSFSQCGYPALMLTDTAPFRNPNYHLDSDTPDTLDYDRLAAVVEATRVLVEGFSPEAPSNSKAQ